MTIMICGIGWLTKDGYGCVAKGERFSYDDAAGPDSLVKKGIFSAPIKNFGRFDRISRMTCFAVALALADSGIEYGASRKQDIGIVGTSAEGSLRTDIEYFRDYLDSGRTLSRGNLFIYTLPSSPLGEAAIHFGLQGPLLYAGGEQRLLAVLDTASEMILAGETHDVLAGDAEADQAVYFVLSGNDDRRTPLCDLSQARTIVQANPALESMVHTFSVFKGSKKGMT